MALENFWYDINHGMLMTNGKRSTDKWISFWFSRPEEAQVALKHFQAIKWPSARLIHGVRCLCIEPGMKPEEAFEVISKLGIAINPCDHKWRYGYSGLCKPKNGKQYCSVCKEYLDEVL